MCERQSQTVWHVNTHAYANGKEHEDTTPPPVKSSASSQRLAGEYEADPVDGVISTCYRLIGSFERAVSDKQALQAISREALSRTLREIANKAFRVGWNSQNLTSIQRAQILDVLLSVANLAEYSFQNRL
jgi:hypothetical protein